MTISETPARRTSWKSVRDEIGRRIDQRVWAPGDMIPNEAELAQEFDCARTTVNRALRELAEQGLVTRKRRAGTRVTLNPPARVTLHVPIFREEIQAKGLTYRHTILARDLKKPPSLVRHLLDLEQDEIALQITTLHLAENRPYALDQRWINLGTVPDARSADFSAISPNEWLVQRAPYTHGDLAFFAEPSSPNEAEHLGVERGAALLILERSTWREQASVTTTRISFAPGHRILTAI